MRKLQNNAIDLVARIKHIETDISKTTTKMNLHKFDAVKLLRRAELFLGVSITYYIGHVIQEFILGLYPFVGLWSFSAYAVVGIIVVIALFLVDWRKGPYQ